ncbi:Eukaryotic translation initiation factor 3 subunit M [Sparganum proliferum]
MGQLTLQFKGVTTQTVCPGQFEESIKVEDVLTASNIPIIELKSFLSEYGANEVDTSEVTQEAIDLLTTVASLIIQLPVDNIPQAVEELCVLYEELKGPLLEIFISGGLRDFSAFTKKYPKFLSENGLTEEACLNKIRILCLMEIAENVGELDYETVCKKIGLSEDQLEAFVIEAVRQKVITCKLDQINRRILITSALPRNSGRAQWLSLAKTLQEWRAGLRVVQNSLGTMIGAAAP